MLTSAVSTILKSVRFKRKVSCIVEALVFVLIIFPYCLSNEHNNNDIKITFVACPGENWDLFVANIDGTELVQLTDTPYDETYPVISKDTKSVVYGASDGVLRIIDIQSRSLQELLPYSDSIRYIQPAFSADGEKLAFSMHYKRSTDNADLAIFDFSSSKVTKIIKQESLQLFPTWSTDLSSLFYINVVCSAECDEIIQEIWKQNLMDTLGVEVLSTQSVCLSPSCSNSGNEIVFSSNMSGNYDVWKYNISNKELRQLTIHPSLDADPDCSANGEMITFTSTRGGSKRIYILDMMSGKIDEFCPFDNKLIECKNPDF